MVSFGKYSQALPTLCRIIPPSTTPRTIFTLPRCQQQTTSLVSLTFNLKYACKTHFPSLFPYCALAPNATANANLVGIVPTKAKESMKECDVRFDEEYSKRVGLQPEKMPRHVALTLDGNRRWCNKNNNGKLTYEPFYRRYIEFGDLCIKLGIPVASWFIFSNCTWKRNDEANDLMFRQLQESLEGNLDKFIRQGIKVSTIGEKWKLPKRYQDAYTKVEEATKDGKTLHMMYAVPYGGREDMLDATRSIARKAMAGEIKLEDIHEDLVERELSTGSCQVPVPDLMIRNGAKLRISNFFLWQAFYAELYFSHSLSSDFDETEFLQALRWFQNSEKRFGK